jgi:hypothetical protein
MATGMVADSRDLRRMRLFHDARSPSVIAPTTDVPLDLAVMAMAGQELF